jgi:transcriptional regulator with XRE-family HTH domain
VSIDHVALRILMEKDGMTAAQLAKQVDKDLSYVCRILSGERTLKRNPGLIKQLAGVLNVPVSMLEHRAPGEEVA